MAILQESTPPLTEPNAFSCTSQAFYRVGFSTRPKLTRASRIFLELLTARPLGECRGVNALFALRHVPAALQPTDSREPETDPRNGLSKAVHGVFIEHTPQSNHY